MKGGLVAWGLAAAAMLAGCGSTPREPAARTSAVDGEPVVLPAPSAFEARQRDRAIALGKEGRLAEAATTWEILTVLRPDVADYRARWAEARTRVDAAVDDHLARAAQADKRGDADGAMQQYLAVMALQPDNARAAQRLRSIERERVRRSYLGKYSRITLTRRIAADAEAQSAAPSARAAESGELEHASLLASQGEYVDAIGLLERRLARQRRDPVASRLLADIYFQKAQAIASTDRAAAVKDLQRAVRLDPANARAVARLKELGTPAAGAATAAVSASASAR